MKFFSVCVCGGGDMRRDVYVPSFPSRIFYTEIPVVSTINTVYRVEDLIYGSKKQWILRKS